jgi:hypothetical protein
MGPAPAGIGGFRRIRWGLLNQFRVIVVRSDSQIMSRLLGED